MNLLYEKLKSVVMTVLPVTIIVLVFHFALVKVPSYMLINFLIGAVLIIIGLSMFLTGVDIAVTPFGNMAGASIVKSNRLWIVIISGIILGFFISIAEPALLILANQVEFVTSARISGRMLVLVVSAGLAFLMSLGLVRILYNVPLYKILFVLYGLILILSLFSSPEFLSIAFDTSGATTGVMAVPFILALAIGISSMKKDSKSSEKDSFGLLAIVSAGPIIFVLLLSIFSDSSDFSSSQAITVVNDAKGLGVYTQKAFTALKDSFISLLPLIIAFLLLNHLSFKLKGKAYLRILKGFIYSFIGLAVFLTGVNAGFMELGTFIGKALAEKDSRIYIIAAGFIIGAVTIIAEPAVYVLTQQIEDVTSGYIKRMAVLIPLSLGVGAAVALSMVRILIPGVQLWHYLIVGYVISLGLTLIVPKLFVGIAFDAGGVATGPMTATFILAFTQGAADSIEGASVLIDGFGMIAMVALTPIITLQILGYFFKIKSVKGGR